MTAFKSEFSGGNGRLKEVAGFAYNDAGSGSLSATLLLDLGSAGFSLNGASALTSMALGTSSYATSNTVLPTKGYVDQAIAGASQAGDATYIDFTVASSAGFSVGQVVAIATTGEPVAAIANSATNSNAIGVVISKPNGTTVRVQVDGRVTTSTNLTGFATGDLTFVSDSTAGSMEAYTGLAANAYAVQVGIVASAAASGIIVLQPRIFGQVA